MDPPRSDSITPPLAPTDMPPAGSQDPTDQLLQQLLREIQAIREDNQALKEANRRLEVRLNERIHLTAAPEVPLTHPQIPISRAPEVPHPLANPENYQDPRIHPGIPMPPGRLFDGQIPPIELCYDQERDPYYNPGLNGDGLETRVMDEIEKLRVELKAMKGDGLEAEEMALYPDACLPIGFQMPRIQQFEGKNTEDPKAHLKAYMRTMQAYRCKEPEFALLFHHSLSGFARRWFLNLNPLQVSKWGDIVKEFYGRFGDNDSALVTKSQLETTCQGEKETFADFVARWQELASQLDDKLKEMELVDMIRNNFRPVVKEQLGIMHIPDFRVLLSVGAKIEKKNLNETSQCYKKNGSPDVNFVQSNHTFRD